MRNYHVATTAIKNGEGAWDYTECKIARHEANRITVIGSYIRRYGNFGKETFAPFTMDGRDFALYSEDYTCTYLMELFDDRFEKIGGEQGDQWGFCPVALYVPKFQLRLHQHGKDREAKYRNFVHVVFDNESEFLEGLDQDETVLLEGSLPVGFVAGCVWGDDSSWKVQAIDLTKAPQGEIVRLGGLMGYKAIPDDRKLNECINFINLYSDFIEENKLAEFDPVAYMQSIPLRWRLIIQDPDFYGLNWQTGEFSENKDED